MTNTTVYPYGIDGSLPSSVGIINDLITGGADNALSAEMGKEIGATIGDILSNSHTFVANRSSSSSTTSNRVPYSLSQGCEYKFTVSLPEAISGTTFLLAFPNTGDTVGQKIVVRIPAGETSVAMAFTSDADYVNLGFYNQNGLGESIQVEIIQTAKGLQSIRDALFTTEILGLNRIEGQWRYSDRHSVKKGDVIHVYGKCDAGAWLVSVRKRDGTPVAACKGKGINVMSEYLYVIEEDCSIVVRSREGSSSSPITTPDVGFVEILRAHPFSRTTDIIVAASNSLACKKQIADYVCDGVNDEDELQRAIIDAQNSGRRLRILTGDYYLDAPTKQYLSENDSFLLIDTTGDKNCIINGESWTKRPVIHLSNSAYESLSANMQVRMLGIYDGDTYGGYVELSNLYFVLPENQKKVICIDFENYGGYARVHSVSYRAYTNGYNGQEITISNPPAVAAEGCVALKFIGKGPNGAFGSEISNSYASGFYEGFAINTEWTVLYHCCSIFCVYGWVFGKYGKNNTISSSTHPIVLINCGDERGVNFPLFYGNSGLQDIEMYAFSCERNAKNTPGGVLGDMAREITPGSFRGLINYTSGQGSGNFVDKGFWEYGHGHGMRTTDMSHAQACSSTKRATYRPNYLEKIFDTTLNKMVVCIDESVPTWVDFNGNVV